MKSSVRELHSRDFRIRHAEFIQERLAMLNLSPNSSASKRIARVIDLIQRAEAIESELLPEASKPGFDDMDLHPKVRAPYHSGYKFRNQKVEARNVEYNRLLRELNIILKTYRWSPILRSFNLMGLDLVWGFNTRGEREEENIAILWITRLVQDRIVNRLRRCRECGKWYYAVTDHQRYCGDACRKKFSSRNDVFKEKRRRYMAHYRRNEKLKSAASLIKARKASKS